MERDARDNGSALEAEVVETKWGNSIIFNPDLYEHNVDMTSMVSVADGLHLPAMFSLQYFQSSLFASILEDNIIQIRILGECNNTLRVLKTMTDIVTLHAKKFSVTQPVVTDELEAINPKNLGKEEYKLDKLANDRKYLYETTVITYLDLSLNRSFMSLHDCNSEVVNREKHREFIRDEESKNRQTSRELARMLRQQRNKYKSITYDTDVSIDKLHAKVEDAALNGEVRSRYITNWQRARSEQHHLTIKNKESTPLENIEYYKQRTDYEQRAHQEIELIVNITINEKLEQVESQMNKYDKDIEALDLKIQIKKFDYTNKLEYKQQLEDTYARHEKLAKDWKHFKVEREKARQYIEKMTNAATVVQAWWRGLLVRMQLGPYKPRRRPPPKEKDKDKKKKK